jgi:hypothetical protein
MRKLNLVRFFNKFAPNRGNTRGSHDVVGEYAVYMMARAACKGAWSLQKRPFRRPCGAANLDALPLCPYTSAVPWMDVILNPAPHLEQGRRAGWKRI